MNDEITQGWVVTTLGDICSKPQYGWTCKASKTGKIKYVRTTDISNGSIKWESVPFCHEPPDDIDKYRLFQNDILVSRAGSVGVSYRIKDVPSDAVFASYLIRFKTLAGIDPLYIECYLKSENYWRAISEFTAGIAIPNVNATKLAALNLPLAPFNEQRRIVAKLEKLLERVDDCKKRLDKIPVFLKRFRQSVLSAACSGKLTEDWRKNNRKTDQPNDNSNGLQEWPVSWHWKKVGELFTVETGTTPPKKDPSNYSLIPSRCPFFKPTDLDKGADIRNAREWLSEKGEQFARILPPLSVCVTSIGATIGKTGLLQIRGATNQQINAILPSDKIVPKFTYYFCCSPYFQSTILENSSCTTLPIINKSRFEELTFPMPPLPEQHEIVRRVDVLFSVADKLGARYTKAKAQVDKLTQSILAKAFRGELVPQDPNDEPASALLERIKKSAIGSRRKGGPSKRYEENPV